MFFIVLARVQRKHHVRRIVRWDKTYLSPWLLRSASPPTSPRRDVEIQEENAGSDDARTVRMKTSYTSCELQDISHSQPREPEQESGGPPHASPLLMTRDAGDEAE